MTLGDIIPREGCVAGLNVHSKKHAIQEVAALAAKLTPLSDRDVFDTLLERERLGSTGLGNGIAIPHGKFAGLGKLFGLCVRLDEPINFEAMDGAPVDILFVLLAPDENGADHLKALAKVAKIVKMPELMALLRDAPTDRQLHEVLTQSAAPAG